MVFSSDDRPRFMKRDDEARDRLARMRELRDQVLPQEKDRLERDLKLWEAGIRGEDQIVFELENSHLPITVIQGLRLEHDGLSAQIDFFVIAPYVSLIIECKNLVGNITVNSKGDFIRETQIAGVSRKEGIYSPVTQCERHAELMKSIRGESKGLVTRLFHELWYEDWNRSVVVLANPKTILDDASAPLEIREKIIRADGLVRYIKDLNGQSKRNGKLSRRDREELAQFWIDHHMERSEDVAARYAPLCPKCGSPMVKRVAKKGDRAGREFWGCSQYPKCRGLINIQQ